MKRARHAVHGGKKGKLIQSFGMETKGRSPNR